MTAEEYREAHPPSEEYSMVECPYCRTNPGHRDPDDNPCLSCEGTGWIDEDET